MHRDLNWLPYNSRARCSPACKESMSQHTDSSDLLQRGGNPLFPPVWFYLFSLSNTETMMLICRFIPPNSAAVLLLRYLILRHDSHSRQITRQNGQVVAMHLFGLDSLGILKPNYSSSSQPAAEHPPTIFNNLNRPCFHPGDRAVVVLSLGRKETEEQGRMLVKSLSGSGLNLVVAAAGIQGVPSSSPGEMGQRLSRSPVLSALPIRCGSATAERGGANRRERTSLRLSTTCCRGASRRQECRHCPPTSCRTPPTPPPPSPKVSARAPALLLSFCPSSSHRPFPFRFLTSHQGSVRCRRLSCSWGRLGFPSSQRKLPGFLLCLVVLSAASVSLMTRFSCSAVKWGADQPKESIVSVIPPYWEEYC